MIQETLAPQPVQLPEHASWPECPTKHSSCTSEVQGLTCKQAWDSVSKAGLIQADQS